MYGRQFMCLVVLFMGVALIGCTKANPNPKEHDGEDQLRLELMISAGEYKADEPIECKAVLSYVGERETFEFYSGDPVVMFAIDGGQYFNGEKDLLNKGQYSHIIHKGEPIEFSFVKYVGWHLNTNEAAVSFWKNFLMDEELVLEPGEYEIFARCSYMLEQGGESSTITVSEKVTVK